jgi:hypothetical protein
MPAVREFIRKEVQKEESVKRRECRRNVVSEGRTDGRTGIQKEGVSEERKCQNE